MTSAHPEAFSQAFAADFRRLLTWRRDVRHFSSTPVEATLLEELVETTQLSPSVGYSQPWRFLSVETPTVREIVYDSVARANYAAALEYADDRADQYRQLKLSGLREAPVHLAVFCDGDTATGKKLGTRTMPQTRSYSAVMAIYTFWLAARIEGLGVGWVSILDPSEITAALDVPTSWELIAYLAVGYPIAAAAEPELRTTGWEQPDPRAQRLEKR